MFITVLWEKTHAQHTDRGSILCRLWNEKFNFEMWLPWNLAFEQKRNRTTVFREVARSTDFMFLFLGYECSSFYLPAQRRHNPTSKVCPPNV
jgi:hypothetical protein